MVGAVCPYPRSAIQPVVHQSVVTPTKRIKIVLDISNEAVVMCKLLWQSANVKEPPIAATISAMGALTANTVGFPKR